MGKVDAVSVRGLDLWFNSSDHLPPHFHARKPGCWEIRVYVLACTPGHLAFTMKWPKRNAGPNRRERDHILAETLQHRAALLIEWEAKVVVKEKF
jgi:hypothetical protein